MSNYVDANYSLMVEGGVSACAILGAEMSAVERMHAVRALTDSMGRAAVAPELTGADAAAHARRLMAALPARSDLGSAATPPLQRAEELLRELTVQPAAAASTQQLRAQLSAAQQAARQAVADVEGAMRSATRTLITRQLVDFAKAPAQDFDSVSLCEGDSVTVVDMRRGNETILVQIGADGTVAREHFGTEGMTCAERDAQLVEVIEAAGVRLTGTVHDPEGGSRGEHLIVPAQERDPEQPARGAMLNAQAPVVRLKAAAPRRKPRRVAPRRRTTGGAA